MKDFLKKDRKMSFGMVGSAIFMFGFIMLIVSRDMGFGMIHYYFLTPVALIFSFIGMFVDKDRNYWNDFVPAVVVIYILLSIF